MAVLSINQACVYVPLVGSETETIVAASPKLTPQAIVLPAVTPVRVQLAVVALLLPLSWVQCCPSVMAPQAGQHKQNRMRASLINRITNAACQLCRRRGHDADRISRSRRPHDRSNSRAESKTAIGRQVVAGSRRCAARHAR